MLDNIANGSDVEDKAWRFQNMYQLFPSRPVKRGEKVSGFEYQPTSFNDFEIEDPGHARLDLSSFLERTETDGLIILHHGKIAFEYYGRTNDENSIHAMMSMTKSIVGLVAGILVGQGTLDVDQAVSSYVPEVLGTSFENVSIRECLDMRSGLLYQNDDPAYRKASGVVSLRGDEEPTDLHRLLSALQTPSTAPVNGLEGAAIKYLSINADLLGWVLERASGKEFGELLSELIWQPVMAESGAYIVTDPAGNARTSGGLCATLRDIARLGHLLVKDDNGIVPASWIHDMLHNGSKQAFNAASWQKSFQRFFKTLAYRSYWLADTDSETLIAFGVHGQMMLIDRSNELVMVKLSSQPLRLDEQKKGLAVAAFKEFQRMSVETRHRPEARIGARDKSDTPSSVANIARSCISFLRLMLSWLKGGGRSQDDRFDPVG